MVGLEERAVATVGGAGVGSLHVAEQLALKLVRVARQPTTVELDVGTFAATQFVDALCEVRLARPGRAEEQHGSRFASGVAHRVLELARRLRPPAARAGPHRLGWYRVEELDPVLGIAQLQHLPGDHADGRIVLDARALARRRGSIEVAAQRAERVAKGPRGQLGHEVQKAVQPGHARVREEKLASETAPDLVRLSREQPQRNRMLAPPEHPDRLRARTRGPIRCIWNPLREVVRRRTRPLSRHGVVPELDRRFRADHSRPPRSPMQTGVSLDVAIERGRGMALRASFAAGCRRLSGRPQHVVGHLKAHIPIVALRSKKWRAERQF